MLGVFLVAILVPGIVLGVFAFRSLKNDKELAERRLGERVQDVAERAKARVREEWLRWNYELEEISRSSDPADHARRLADRGVIVIADGGSVVLPADTVCPNSLTRPAQAV